MVGASGGYPRGKKKVKKSRERKKKKALERVCCCGGRPAKRGVELPATDDNIQKEKLSTELLSMLS